MDGLNRRVKKDVTASTDVRYLYDGWRSIQEETVEAWCSVLARYVYGLAYLDELVRMDRDADGDGDRLGEGYTGFAGPLLYSLW